MGQSTWGELELKIKENIYMVEARLEALVNRLEACVGIKEGGGAKPAAMSAPVAQGSASNLGAEFTSATGDLAKKLEEACATLGVANVTGACNSFIKTMNAQPAFFATMSSFSKPADISFMQGSVQEHDDAIVAFEKDRKLPRANFDHLKVIKDGLLIFNWWQFDDAEAVHDNVQSNYEGIFFAGNKILKKDSANDVAWFNAFKNLCEACYNFIKAREGSIFMWTGSQTGDAKAFLDSAIKNGGGSTAPVTSAP